MASSEPEQPQNGSALKAGADVHGAELPTQSAAKTDDAINPPPGQTLTGKQEHCKSKTQSPLAIYALMGETSRLVILASLY